MFGAFSNPQNNTNTAAPSGGLFGAANNQQQQPQQQTGGLFGAPANQQQQQQPSGGLFGAPAQNSAPSLFGNPAPTNTQAPSLFGNTQNTTQTQGGGLFGGQQQQPAQNTGGGLFGGTAQPAQGTSGGLFGGATTQQPAQGTSGGLFGSTTTQQPAAGGGLFGNTTNQQQQQTGTLGGLFGNSQQQQPNTTAAPTGAGLFGNTLGSNNSTTGGSLFGNKPAGSLFGGQSSLNINTNVGSAGTNTNPLFGGGLGQPQQQQQQQPSGSLFGGLGQSTTAGNSNSLFGGNNSILGASALGGGLGASTSNNLLSRSTAPAQQPADAQAQFAKLTQRIESVAQAWDATSKDCRFQHYFYNLVDPQQVKLYGRPPNATNEELWQKAVRENPDPNCLVPVVAVGFDDLRQRVEAQSQQAAVHQEKLQELKSRLDALAQRHSLSNAPRLQRAAAQDAQLTHRLLALAQHLHLLLPALRSSALRPAEEALRGRLEAIEEELRRGRGRGRLNELWALVGAVNAARERARGGGAQEGRGEWAVVDEEGLAQIAQILSEQQAGLAHLTKILQQDLKDLVVIVGGGDAGDSAMQDDGHVESWGSTTEHLVSAPSASTTLKWNFVQQEYAMRGKQ